MKKCTIVLHDEVNCSIYGLNQRHKDHLKELYGKLVPTRFYNIKFKLGQWDGKINYFKDNGDTYVHLLEEIVPYLHSADYNILLEDNRISKICQPDLIDENYLNNIILPTGPLVLREHQVRVINALVADGQGLGIAATGAGKCLDPETPILMSDGSIKKIKDIVVGDTILGDDHKIRNVLKVTNGTSKMYRITPDTYYNDPWTCNDKHTLTLICVNNTDKYTAGQVVDIDIQEYFQLDDDLQNSLHQYSVMYDGWSELKFPLSPYVIGCWLFERNTDGHIDKPKEKKLEEFWNDSKKTIPLKYLSASRRQRIVLLLGITDTTNSFNKDTSRYELFSSNESLLESILMIARSVGCFGYLRKDNDIFILELLLDFNGHYRKYEEELKDTYNNPFGCLTTDFSIEELDESEYIGLVVDGNQHFLKSDFTVVHNTFITGCLTKIYENECNYSVITIVPNKTLVRQTHKDYLMLEIDSGVFYGNEKDLSKKHLVSTWQSLKNNPELMKNYQALIVDECHMAKGPVLQDLLLKHGRNIPIRFGVTGTMPKEEIDAFTVNLSLGRELVNVPASELIDKGLLAKLDIEIYLLHHDLSSQYNSYIKDFKSTMVHSKPVTYNEFRNTYFPDYASEKAFNNNSELHMSWIASKLIEERDSGGNVLCLVDNVSYGRRLAEMIEGAIFLSGADKVKDREKVYAEFADRDDIILIATAQIASTGLNIIRIFRLAYTNFGKSGIKTIQSIGRGLRIDEDDKQKLKVLDFSGDLKYGKRHTNERINFYKEAKYPFKKTTIKFNDVDESDMFD